MAALLVGVSPAAAQTSDGGPDPAKVRVRIGPLMMNPTISLSNFGIDDNVFNDPATKAPKRDFTATVTPQTDLWVRMGRTWINGIVKEDIVWFQKYRTERSANTSYTLAWRVPLTRMSFTTTANWLKTRERPGFEIDARSARGQHTYGVTAELRALSKTFVGVRGEWVKVDFDRTSFFRGTNLRDELNRKTTTAGLTLRHQLTPLTSLTFGADRTMDRFELAPLRDSDSMSFHGGVQFAQFALIQGNATVGYRAFEPRSPAVPGYDGSTIEVNLSYTLAGATRFSIEAARDVEYSYDFNQPYYLQTGAGFTFSQQVFGPVDVVARISAQRLEYRNRAGAQVVEPDRTDHRRSYGMGFGYRFAQAVRLGFDVDKQQRTSPIDTFDYEGLKYGTSMTYGF